MPFSKYELRLIEYSKIVKNISFEKNAIAQFGMHVYVTCTAE
jgi:hypothetical protein